MNTYIFMLIYALGRDSFGLWEKLEYDLAYDEVMSHYLTFMGHHHDPKAPVYEQVEEYLKLVTEKK